MDTQRLILFFVFSFSLLMLWTEWEKGQRPKPPAVTAAAQQPREAKAVPGEVPTPAPAASPIQTTVPAASPAPAALKGETIQIRTDLLVADIDTLGGSVTRVELLKHKETNDLTKNLVLLGPEHQYFAQSGLTGDGPNHRTLWRVLPGERALADGKNTLELRLAAEGKDGLAVEKVYTFKRDSYVIDVALDIRNTGTAPVAPHAYFQLTHDGKEAAAGHSIAQSFGAKSFHGFAEYTTEKKFEKIQYSDIDKGKFDHAKQASDGWIAFVEHYFVAAWVPSGGATRDYVVEKRPDGVYAARVVLPVPAIAPGATARVDAPLYAGPQEQGRLKEVAPGFDLVVDYGWLTIIAWPLFWLLSKYHSIAGNWGVAIILLTVTLKLVFFPLSAASYKSMAKMKLVTPRLTKIREMYANDRARQNQAMMELYKTEKINPLGGCFPILVQIPVFIALYWVLLAAIELRHAPFMLWIHDLSALDPFYVLPVLMTVTMVIQTRLNPVPPDPVQAKVMMFMPFVFSIFFFFFPAGLVLYWLVNNILSIAQQWQIQRMFERDKPAHAKR
ncbi:MAG: membrane protein insertase YidC [Proteobacteria bacterium]|nr:membrane protein insertase YidC [Pseudomonadota bacterium]